MFRPCSWLTWLGRAHYITLRDYTLHLGRTATNAMQPICIQKPARVRPGNGNKTGHHNFYFILVLAQRSTTQCNAHGFGFDVLRDPPRRSENAEGVSRIKNYERELLQMQR